MRLRYLTITILVVFGLLNFSNTTFSSEGDIFPATIRITCPQKILKEIVQNYPIDLIRNDSVDLFITFEIYQKLLEEFGSEIEKGDVSISILQSAREAKENFSIQRDTHSYGYHNYSSMVSELKSLESQYPEICKLYDIGDAEGGRHDIWALKISDNVATEEDEPGVFYTGAHHGNERPTVEMVMLILTHLLENYGSDSNITDLVNDTQIFLVPMMNPWGHSNNRRTNVHGIDLNRNYPTSWGPLSESETRAVVEGLIAKHHFVAGIDYHTYGGYYMYPWASSSKKPSDYIALKRLSDEMAHTANYRSLSIIDFLGGSGVRGSSVDYHYGAHDIFGFGVELGNSHSPPVSQMEQICSKNLDGAIMLLERVHHATVTGHVTDNGRPVVAEVTVKGIDKVGDMRTSVKSDKTFGRYYRLLPPGTYDITFSYNHKQVEKKGVVVTNESQTILDVDFSGKSFSAFDGFESKNFSGGKGWKGRWTKKGDVRLIKKKPFEGKYYVRLRKNTGHLERTVDLSAASSAKLTFAGRIRSFEKGDMAYVKISPDGVTYHTVKEFSSDDSDNTYHTYEIDLSHYEMTSDFRILFDSEMSKKKDYWYIDSIEISGVK